MRWDDYLNEQEIRKTIAILKPDNELFEVRILGGSKKQIISGYFRDADTLIKAFDTIDVRGKNVYITLGKLKNELFSRMQSEKFLQTNQTTSDHEVIGYDWLFVDLDPVRPSGISSSNEELNKAKELAKKVYSYLRSMGFNEPVKALSGNGCHLLYRVKLENTEDNEKIIENCLKSLSMMFDTSEVKIDTTNYNPSRICKLHGTLAQKGANTKDRPHRMSRIFTDSLNVEITPKIFLQKLASEFPEDPQPIKPQKYQAKEFDIVDFMDRNGLTYEIDSNSQATIYRLDHCPFDYSHVNGDSKIFSYSNGAIAFKCHHNSCRHYKWQDVRLKFEPDAYDQSYDDEKYEKGWEKHNRDKSQSEIVYTELTDDGTMFRTAREIEKDPEPQHEYIRSGITVIDEKLGGLQKTGVTVISGLRASGKSTLIGQLINNAINDGQTVVCYSGELNNKKYLNWLIKQAAGKNNIEIKANGSAVNVTAREKIIDWMGDRFYLYNNKYGNKFEKIETYLRSKLKEVKADLCIIDNLMALNLESYDKDKYEAQTKFVWALKNLAELTNTHIIFVAHPKKSNGFLRLNDISGSGNISNIVDNAFVIHRWNKDFENGYKETFRTEVSNDIAACNNVIEIAKDRENGTQDVFVPLYFEESTKRLLNDPAEYITYKWESEETGFHKVDDDFEEIPF